MIRIAYSSELQPGLNGRAERLGRGTVVYLLPGLTPAERAATLRRLRQHGRMGLSPRLPRGQLGLALLADRVRMAFGQAGAIVRIHPAGSTLPVVAVSAAVVGFLLLSVQIKVVHTPVAAGASTGRSPNAASSAGVIPGAQARGQGSKPGVAPIPSAGRGHAPGTRPAPGASRGPGSGQSWPAPAPRSTSSAPVTVSSTAASSPPPSSASSPAPSPATSSSTPGPASSASPAQSASSSTRVCVSIGPFGVCLGL